MSDRVGGGLNCCVCGDAVYGNADDCRRVECGRCVQGRVKYVQRIEKQSGITIRNKHDYAAAMDRCKDKPVLVEEPTTIEREESPNPAVFIPDLKPIDRKELPLRWEDLL